MKHKNLFTLFVVICIFVLFAGCSDFFGGNFTTDFNFNINLDGLQLSGRSATQPNELGKLSVELISKDNSVSLKQEQNIIDYTNEQFTFKNIRVGTIIKISATISQEDVELYVGETEWLNVKPSKNLISLTLEKIVDEPEEPEIPIEPETKVSLTFDSNGGSSVEAMTGIVGENITAPTNPTKTGYTFAGWEPELPEVFPEEDTTYTAQWLEKGTYKITYKLDGGENNSANPPTYKETDADITLYDPTKSCYTFEGWYTDPEFTNKVDVIDTDTKENITLYAQWKAIEGTIKVTFPSYSDQTYPFYEPITEDYKIKFTAASGYSYTLYVDDVEQVIENTIEIDTTNMAGGIYTVMLIATNVDTGEMYSAEYQIEITK